MTLPIDLGRDPLGPSRLIRSFGNPRVDPRTERLVLRMDAVPGLTVARLNDEELACPAPGESRIEIDLSPLVRERNVLTLDVRPLTDPLPGLWGEIALVVVPRGDLPEPVR